jgi:hypothetical protein
MQPRPDGCKESFPTASQQSVILLFITYCLPHFSWFCNSLHCEYARWIFTVLLVKLCLLRIVGVEQVLMKAEGIYHILRRDKMVPDQLVNILGEYTWPFPKNPALKGLSAEN